MQNRNKKRKDYSIDDFLKETEKELEELDTIGDILESENDSVNLYAAENALDRFITSEEEIVDYPIDGHMEITVTEDEMEAYADFYPPSTGQRPLNSDDASRIIEQHKIVYGVRWNEVNDSLFRCNTEGEAVRDVLIAAGVQPVDEVPAHYWIEETLMDKREEINSEVDRVDFREVSPFILVRKGDVLARRIPKKEGEYGYTVFGKAVPYGKEEIQYPKPGRNTQLQNGTVTAACDGRFEIEDDSFYVNEVLQIEGDVDYSTGHIDFPGDVILKGQVKDGFKVEAGGSIFCGKTLDASYVVGKKDLTVTFGIIGRKKGSIKVGGKVQAKFIENCYVEAGDTIYLDVGIINSAVYTSDRVELGKKGIIIGGTVNAQNGVTATQIGSATGPRTEIYCGTDYIVTNKLEWIRDNTVKLAYKLTQIEERLKKEVSHRKQLIALQDKIKQSIHTLNESAQTLVYKLDKNDNAEVVVKGKIFPGVYIEICHISYVVGREMDRVRFRLNKEQGIIATEKISK